MWIKSGKSNTPGTPVTESAPTPAGEDTAEPVQHIETPSDEKGVAEEVSKAELMELLGERETLLQEKDKTIEELREKVLRSYAEIENVMARARREAENTRKFALQVKYMFRSGGASVPKFNFHINLKKFQSIT